ARRQLGHPQADLQAGLAAIQPQLLVEGNKALAAVGTVIPAPGEGILPVPGNELARLAAAIPAPAPAAGAGGLVLVGNCRLLLPLQQPTLQFVVHHLADVFDRLFNLIQRLGLLGHPLPEHVARAGEHLLNQALAVFRGHGAPPPRRTVRLERGSPAARWMTPQLLPAHTSLACLPGSWFAPGSPRGGMRAG